MADTLITIIDRDLAARLAQMKAELDAGAESAEVAFGHFTARLTDKHDGEHGVIRITVDDFIALVRHAHANGAALALNSTASVVAGFAGITIAAPEAKR